MYSRTDPKEITEERFLEMLNVLPPMKWRRDVSTESFMISEFLQDDLVMIFCRIGEKYYEMQDVYTLSHPHIVENVYIKFPTE